MNDIEWEVLDFTYMMPAWTMVVMFNLIEPKPLLLKERWDE